MNRNFENRKPTKVYAKSKENQMIIKALNMYGRVPEMWELLEEIERLNNIINELKKENKQLKEGINKTEQYEHLRHYHNLLPMKQYPLERDVFCKIFRKIDSDFYDELYDTTTESFKVWRYDDEFYILHLESGTIINWYKHLGRCNTCNKNLSIEEYKKLADDLYNELKGSDKEDSE